MQLFNLEEIQEWAREGGAIARQHFNRVAGWRKADRSFVTEADGQIEALLVERIRARYPEHGIIGEEQARHSGSGEFLWALDPLDGTASFIAGLPTWGVSIGVLRYGQPYLGVLYMPLLDDCYWADGQGGAWYNGMPIHTIDARPWDSEDWLAIPSNAHRRFTIDFPAKVRSTGSTAAAIAYVARGRALGALVGMCSIWDIAAALAMLSAAGGVAIGLDGQPFNPAPFIDGQQVRQPLVFASQAHATALAATIHPK